VPALAFGPKAKLLATAATDGRVRIHEAATTNRVATLDKQPDYLHALAWSPTGHRLATGCDDGSYSVFDSRSRKLLKRWFKKTKDAKEQIIWSLVFSADGRTLYSADGMGRIQAWDPVRGIKRFGFPLLAERVLEIALDRTGERLASGGGDGKVGVWNLKSRKRERLLGGHGKGVYAVAWHPTLPVLASGSADGTVRLWDTRSWLTVQRLDVTKDAVYGLAFSSDGQRLAVSCGGGRLQVFRSIAPPAKPAKK
jgi:WD40 repeat protein